jgi:hypothetical protein
MSRRPTRIGMGAVQPPARNTDIRPKAPEVDDEPPSGVLERYERLMGVPRLAMSLPELMEMRLDHRAGFLVSLVDGIFTVEMILDACAMKREEALAILAELSARGIIVIDQSEF